MTDAPTPTPRPKFLPPFGLLTALIVMIALHSWLPLRQLLGAPWKYLGYAVMFSGITLTVVGAGLFRRRGTGIKPFSEATVLVTAGPFRFTRNPMYLGMVLALFGTAIAMGTLTPFVVIPFFIWWIDARFICREEIFLRERFGENYKRYCAEVRRWI